MKLKTLAVSARDHSRASANHAELDQRLLTLLTETGPEFCTGPVLVTATVFENVHPVFVWTALALHECGRWGSCDPRQIIENDRALTAGGDVLSRWSTQNGWEFTVETALDLEEEMTVVSVTADAPVAPELGLSAIRLGDVLIDYSLHAVPLEQIWFALREHEMGSPGDTDLFPRQSSFPRGSTAVSWWAHPFHEELPFLPFWIVTDIAEPRLTEVFAGEASDTL